MFTITQYVSPSSFDLTLAANLTVPSLFIVISASFIEQFPGFSVVHLAVRKGVFPNRSCSKPKSARPANQASTISPCLIRGRLMSREPTPSARRALAANPATIGRMLLTGRKVSDKWERNEPTPLGLARPPRLPVSMSIGSHLTPTPGIDRGRYQCSVLYRIDMGAIHPP